MTVGTQLSAALRARTPAVLRAESLGWALFDGPGGTQLIDSSIDASAALAASGISNRHGLAPHSDAIEALVERSRDELRQLFDAPDYVVAFGQNATSLAFAVSHGLARTFNWSGTSVVVTELDHSANIDPWSQALGRAGASVDMVRVDADALDIDYADLEMRTPRLLAVSAGSNAIGVQPDLKRVSEFAQVHDALLVLDCVQVTPHGPPSLRELGADLALCSAYKAYGPHIGAILIRRELADQIAAYKVAPAPNRGDEKFETGTQNFEALAGFMGALDGLASLSGGVGAAGARETFTALGRDEEAHAEWLTSQLREMPGVRVFRPSVTGPGQTPIIAFTIVGHAPGDVALALRAQQVVVASGDFYATPLSHRLDVAATGGWVRAGISGYTSREDCARLAEAVASL